MEEIGASRLTVPMPKSNNLEETIIDNIKFGALDVINKALYDTIQAQTDPLNWSPEDKMKYFLILDVQEEILRRVNRTFAKRKRKSLR